MRRSCHLFLDLLRNRKAATAVEYGLILALIFLALMVGVRFLGNANASLWGNVSNRVQNASA